MEAGPDLRRARRPGEPEGPRVERCPVEGSGDVWRVRALGAARQVLQARASTTQAGFTAEWIPKGYLRHHPILISDGPLHDDQRRKVGRFFAPTVVARRYTADMEACADELLGAASAAGRCRLDDLALRYSVEVTRRVVGLTESSVEGMCRRLESFFNQPPFDLTRPRLGRTPRQWARAAVNGLVPVVRFYLADVRPAIRRRRRTAAEDVVSHLIAEGYTDADILVECVTYGTAGMVTTREFITMAAWHLLTDASLRSRFTDADRPGRLGVLSELIRLEPVVGHLYRRVQQPVALSDSEDGWTAAPGDLVDLFIRAANTDPAVIGDRPLDLCPGRPLPPGVDAAGLSFGDGAHKCPGQPLALLETEVLLTRLLAREPRLVSEPALGWDDLIAGYTLRGLELAFDPPDARPAPA